MERRIGVLVAAGAVLVAGVTTAVAVSVTDEDERWAGHRDGMTSMMHGASVSSEYTYLAEMVAHHEEAVAAAEQLQRSQRAEMRELGDAVITSQSAQIDLMRQWLDEWYPNRSGQVDYTPMMRDLSDLSGDQLDQAFLQDMLGHHMGAVMMSQQLLMRGVADHEQVETLAETIRDEQHAEIFQMQEWLQEWFGVGWQHGMRGGMHGRG